jgi:hypothetical protein
MKSIVSKQPCVKELPFPKLMISRHDCVVLFEYYNKGVCINAGTTGNLVGVISENWAMENFKDFHGSVCLENDK